ncbi:MAG TPA: flavodoxin family protein [Feifaniaceae bacterium]|nr:flavodoxin family protein [Feifaniaceae bacterium]
MNVAVVNGNARYGSTWHCKELFLEELNKLTGVTLTEFTLPGDMPHFCAGCFNCFFKGEKTCPHANSVQPIVQALLAADVIVMTSPVYVFGASGQMKAFLDHLGYLWLPHRPHPSMFHKIGVTISTTAGAGLSHAARTMANSLKYWGARRVLSFRSAVAASSWDEVTEKKRVNIRRQMRALAENTVKNARRVEKLPVPLIQRVMFSAIRSMMKKGGSNARDLEYWKEQGWLGGDKTPFARIQG